MSFARRLPGQLAVSRRERRSYLNRYVRSESGGRRTEKQPTGRGPEGCVENGPAAVRRPRDRLRIDLDMRPLTASPARTVRPRPDRRPILNATTSLLYARRCTRLGLA